MTPEETALDSTVLIVHEHTVEKTGAMCHAQHSVTVRQVVVAALRDPEIRSAIKEALADDKPINDSS